jgi:hypothetical protein
MLEEYLARAMHAERIQELDREHAAEEARRLLGLSRPSLFGFFRRSAQARASRASSAARAAGQPVSSIE